MIIDSLERTPSFQNGKIQIHDELSIFLDSVRGAGALIVFLSHFNQIYLLPFVGINSYPGYLSETFVSYAVMAFFVLSGFVITTSILKNIERSGRFEWKPYFLSRVARIYPPFLFSLLLSAAVYWIITGFNLHGSQSFQLPGDLYIVREKITFDFQNYLKSLFMLPGFVKKWRTISINGPLWTIFYEFWMYMIAMFIAIWVKNKRVWAGAVPVLGIGYFLYTTGNTRFIFFALIWAIGAGAAFLYHKKVKFNRRVVIPILVIIPAVLLQEFIRDNRVILPYRGNAEYIFQFLTVFWLTMLMHFTWLRKRLFVRFFFQSARYSYTLYVIHFPILLLSFSFLHIPFDTYGWIFRTIVFMGLSIVTIGFSAWISRYIEDKRYFSNLIQSGLGYLSRLTSQKAPGKTG